MFPLFLSFPQSNPDRSVFLSRRTTSPDFKENYEKFRAFCEEKLGSPNPFFTRLCESTCTKKCIDSISKGVIKVVNSASPSEINALGLPEILMWLCAFKLLIVLQCFI